MKAFVIPLLLLLAGAGRAQMRPATIDNDSIRVRLTTDFTPTGDGTDVHWQLAQWHKLTQRKGSDVLETRFKTLYSATGIYFLFDSQDQVLTASKTADFEKLWHEDVVEVFLWPDTMQTIYFEYELSPLNYELPILVPNLNGAYLGWRPWQYTGERAVRHATKVRGGDKRTGAAISGWSAEFFIPFALLTPLTNVPARPGSAWRANLYRVDYDHDQTSVWSWQQIEKNFHEFRRFGWLVFE